MSSIKPPLRIALTGAKGAGKSTLAELLCKVRLFNRLSFAVPLKNAIQSLFGIDRKWLHDPDLKEIIIPELGVSARQLCQVIGTELFRNELHQHLPDLKLLGGRGIWIHAMLKNIQRSGDYPILIDDCRFEDEYQALKAEGFTVVKIVRPCLESESDKHASEQGCSSDFTITNDGMPQDLLLSFAKLIDLSDSDQK
jgi:hypothetical protein